MGLEDQHKIDAIVEEPVNGSVRLLMMEHREWTLSEEQVTQLQDKISAYYNFFVSGQLQKVLPSSVGRKCVVELHCQFKPPKKLMDQFPGVAALFSKQSIAFRVVQVQEVAGSALTWPLFP